jgi:hypothetical protein
MMNAFKGLPESSTPNQLPLSDDVLTQAFDSVNWGYLILSYETGTGTEGVGLNPNHAHWHQYPARTCG